jgi:hypothetical protein
VVVVRSSGVTFGVARAVDGWVSPRMGCERIGPVDGRGFLAACLGRLCRGLGRLAVLGTCSIGSGDRVESPSDRPLIRFGSRSDCTGRARGWMMVSGLRFQTVNCDFV